MTAIAPGPLKMFMLAGETDAFKPNFRDGLWCK
jgi:hypothetical protein